MKPCPSRASAATPRALRAPSCRSMSSARRRSSGSRDPPRRLRPLDAGAMNGGSRSYGPPVGGHTLSRRGKLWCTSSWTTTSPTCTRGRRSVRRCRWRRRIFEYPHQRVLCRRLACVLLLVVIVRALVARSVLVSRALVCLSMRVTAVLHRTLRRRRALSWRTPTPS